MSWVWCVSFLHPSPLCIYRREPRGGLQPRLKQPISNLHMEPEGGGAHGLLGQPAWSAGLPVGPPTFPFGLWVTSWAHLSMARGLASVVLVSCSGGPSNPCFDTCRILIYRNVVSWIIPHHYAAKLVQNHLHTF